ncbi:uncharacterized protein PG998_009071 [Apiospora kogelbergensis]|uniref:uncharacterized protein n=1 Tax=Apiospora kogelbergensis TaxID=1337665 RepID=UPI00312FF5A8
MERLSPEIIWKILDEIECDGNSKLASCATISSVWQHAVETRSFKYIHVESTAIPTFQNIFARATHRQSYLQLLQLEIVLPTDGKTESDRIKNQLIFRQAIQSFLDVLSTWDAVWDGSAPDSPRLSIAPLSPHLAFRENHGEEAKRVQVISETRDPSLARRFLALPTNPVAPKLPIVPCAGNVFIQHSPVHVMHPLSVCQIAGAFTNVERLRLDYCDPAPKHRQLRLQRRNELAQGLTSLCGKLPRLKRLTLQRNPGNANPIRNHSFRCQDFTDDQGIDLLCEAIRKLSQPTVTHLSMIGGHLSSDLFVDRRSKLDSPGADTWHALQRLILKVDFMSPDGRWYGTGRRARKDPRLNRPASPDTPTSALEVSDSEESESEESGSDDESASERDEKLIEGETQAVDEWGGWALEDCSVNGDRPCKEWRREVDATTLETLLCAWSDALLQDRMPRFKTGELVMPDYRWASSIFAAECASAGQKLPSVARMDRFAPRPETRRWAFDLDNMEDWKAGEELMNKWRQWVGETGSVTIDDEPIIGDATT